MAVKAWVAHARVFARGTAEWLVIEVGFSVVRQVMFMFSYKLAFGASELFLSWNVCSNMYPLLFLAIADELALLAYICLEYARTTCLSFFC